MRDVLSRPSLVAKFPILGTETTNQRLEQFIVRSEIHAHVPKLKELPRDPDDEPYLNLAISTKAKYLVTRDHDLLDLMKDRDFTTEFPNLTSCDPVQFLTTLVAMSEPHELFPHATHEIPS